LEAEVISHPLAPFLGAVVRTQRLSFGWSQEELALRAKIYPNQISLLERAERNSTLPTVEPVALALGVSCSHLIWQAEMLRRRVEREEAKMQG
jgi:XRE family transcriptional regulator, regulator of sulfur utilization